jgi:DnaJ homologue, subfamily C, member 28, conserved domain
MAGVDDIIKQWVQKVEATGELRNHPEFGKPFRFDDGYLETPDELRMVYKILKNAGYVPAEVEMLNRLAGLKERIAATSDAAERDELRAQLADLQQRVAIVLDKLRTRR